jgi:hypothetical protein
MADRYWVGGTASWDGTAGTKWATTSGGAGGASVPTSADDVFFDANSTGTVTIATGNTGAKSINCTGFTGTLTGTAAITISGSITLATGMTYSHTGLVTFNADATINSAGKNFSPFDVNGSGITVQLGAALTTASNQNTTITQGTFTTNNFAFTTSNINSSNSNTRTINFGSSTVAIGGSLDFTTSTNLTFNAGTSQINFTGNGSNLLGSGQTFYNVTWTNGQATTKSVTGSNTYNNLQFNTPTGNGQFTITGNQTVNGTLRLSSGTPSAFNRVLYVSSIIGTQVSFKIAALSSVSDCDFRDITVDQTGTVTTITGTRLGDCGGNSYITFPAPKTVYRVGTGTTSFLENSWSNTSGGTANQIYYPLPQDTAIFDDNTTASSIVFRSSPTPNVSFANRTVAFTTNFNFVGGSQHYGDLIFSSAITINGGSRAIFYGRGIQNITSAGKQMTFPITVNAFTGTVRLSDAYSVNSGNAALILTSGTFDANDYNTTFTNTGIATGNWGFNSSGTVARTVNIGSGTWLFTQTSNTSNKTLWDCSTSTNLTVTGSGVISFGGTTQKTFIGGGIQTYPTLNQGGTGTLTVSGSNKFIGLTNTAIGRIQFTNGTTNEFTTTFNINGVAGTLLQLGSTTTAQAILVKPTAWLMGANSTNGGNNTGLSFTAGGGIDYLSVSYINGQVSAPAATNSNFFLMFA